MAIKVFWLSSINPLQPELSKTGTWIQSMYRALKGSEDVLVCAVAAFTTENSFAIDRGDQQTTIYSVPKGIMGKGRLPTNEVKEFISKAIKEQQPDIIHVWGIENYWGIVLLDKSYERYKKLVDIQGVKSLCANKFVAYGALPYSEIKKMYRLREWILPRFRIEEQRKEAEKWRKFETEILENCTYINTQSEWVRAVLPMIVNSAHVEKTGIILRDSFMKSEPWYIKHEKNEDPIIFTIVNNTPRKGLHITLQALSLIRKKYPKVRLMVAGMKRPVNSLTKGGYSLYIYKMIHTLGLEGNVSFIGFVDETKLLSNLYQSDVFVTSSFIETYCLSLAEALALGVPSVAAYSSALPELVKEGDTGLLYPVGDVLMCSHQILKFLDNKKLSDEISHNASFWYRTEKDSESIVRQQILTYKKIMFEK